MMMLLSATVFAQSGKYERMAARYMNSQIYHEIVVLPGSESPEAYVLFRIPNDRLIFMRNRDAIATREYQAEVVVTAEFYQDRRKFGEQVWRGEHVAATYDQTLDRELDVTGHLSFPFSPGSYAYRLRISDENAEQEMVLPVRPFRVPAFDGLATGKALMSEAIEQTGSNLTVKPIILGGNAAYGKDGHAVLPVGLPEDVGPDDVSVEISLQKLDQRELAREASERRKAMERAARRRDDNELVFEPERTMEGGTGVAVDDDGVRYEWISLPADPGIEFSGGRFTLPTDLRPHRMHLLSVDYNGAHLANGSYVLDVRVKAAGEEAVSKTRFSTHWRNMPISLNDPDVAIENLGFILSRSEVRAMRKGSKEEKIQRFEEFWKAKDPTPETEYNELLAEYYRRIDHAAFTFRTGGEPLPNGLDTDRSRVYVVEGPPANVEREFPGTGGVVETWTYPDGSTFVFEAASGIDEYKLVARS